MLTIPILISLIAAFVIFLISRIRPHFRFFWLIAVGGSFFSFIFIILWYFRLPVIFSLPAWNDIYPTSYSPSWIVNRSSWPIALSLISLEVAAILQSNIRKKSNPLNLAAILSLIPLGILAIISSNYITLAVSWILIDLIELISIGRSFSKAKSSSYVSILTMKLSGILLLLWAAIISNSIGIQMNFKSIPSEVGVILILASFLRVGFLPRHLSVNKLNQAGGMPTVSRIVSTVSGLALLRYLPANSDSVNFALILTIIGTLIIILSITWLFAKDEVSGRPYLFFSVGLLSLSSALLGIQNGIEFLLISIILCGGLIFLYTYRNKKNRWIPIIGIWGLSALPFSLNHGLLSQLNPVSNFSFTPLLCGYSLMLAGYIKHSTISKPDLFTNINQRWENLVYSTGLVFLLATSIFLGIFEWFNTHEIQYSWMNMLPMGFALLTFVLFNPIQKYFSEFKLKYPSIKHNYISSALWNIYYLVRRVIQLINSILEGDGGILWSLVILLLFITIISSFSQ